ncbi:MAG: trypsin-like peptidase domain-containing protein, partial [Nannocystaceae bacterium]
MQQLPFNFPGAGDQPRARGQGSGFVISGDGLVVTNHHVVEGSDSLEVKLKDGRRFKAKVLGSDPHTDVALLQLEGAKNLPTVGFGDSNDLAVGDWVVALGSPMGLEQSATTGIVSAKGRGSLGLYRNSYIDFLQTDAAISQGNSGGPLFNLSGEVVGINTAIHARGRGIGFAVPIDQVKHVLGQLKKDGKVVRGWLGISGRDIEPAIGQAPVPGAVVGEVHPGTPASKGGLQTGDRITAIDSNSVESFADLRGRIAEKGPGQKVKLTVNRKGKAKTLHVALGKLPSDQQLAQIGQGKAPGTGGLYGGKQPRLGVEVAPGQSGLEVKRVANGSVGERLGLQPGDILSSVNGQPISSVGDVAKALGRDANRVEVKVQRGSTSHSAVIEQR